MSRLRALVSEHGIWLTAILTVVVFLGLFVFGESHDVVRALDRVRVRTVVTVIALTSAGYVFRFLKWHLYIRRLSIELTLRHSALTFFSGLMMVVTPGKAGELWKAWFLRDTSGVQMSKTASVVGAERVTDLVALSVMGATGIILFRQSSRLMLGVMGGIAAGILIIQWRRFCLGALDRLSSLPVVGKFAVQIRDFYEGTYELFQFTPLTVATLLSLAAWGLEGIALWMVLGDLGANPSLLLGMFVFGLGSVVGAVSLLPGGVGAAEASMVGLLVKFGYAEAAAVAATLVIRIGTLWYAAALGTLTFLGHSVITNEENGVPDEQGP